MKTGKIAAPLVADSQHVAGLSRIPLHLRASGPRQPRCEAEMMGGFGDFTTQQGNIMGINHDKSSSKEV